MLVKGFAVLVGDYLVVVGLFLIVVEAFVIDEPSFPSTQLQRLLTLDTVNSRNGVRVRVL